MDECTSSGDNQSSLPKETILQLQGELGIGYSTFAEQQQKQIPTPTSALWPEHRHTTSSTSSTTAKAVKEKETEALEDDSRQEQEIEALLAGEIESVATSVP